jgi:hypothetical protein
MTTANINAAPATDHTLICAGGGINWSWYAHITIHPNGTASVDREYRIHDSDRGHPKTGRNTYRMIEKTDKPELGQTFGKRFVIAVEVNGNRYKLKGGKVPRWGSFLNQHGKLD